MRRQAKPFVVEVKKSRKSPGQAEGMPPLIPDELMPRPAQSAPLLEAQQVFARFGVEDPPAAPARAADPVRILPDLTPSDAPAAADEPPRRGRPRKTFVESPKPRKVQPVAIKIGPVRPPRPVAVRPAPVPAAPPIAADGGSLAVSEPRGVIRRQPRRAEPRLPAGQRWKRRLPPALR